MKTKVNVNNHWSAEIHGFHDEVNRIIGQMHERVSGLKVFMTQYNTSQMSQELLSPGYT